jgi:hypothetical protein
MATLINIVGEKNEKNFSSKILLPERCAGHYILPFRENIPDNRCQNCTPDKKNRFCQYYRPVSQPNLKNFEVTN